jgi:hypothetical protein
MKQTLESLIQFCSKNFDNEKHKGIHAFHYDHSGHVVATNSHVLFATKRLFDIKKGGKTYSKKEYQNGKFIESKFDFPDWKMVLPEVSARRIRIVIPKWFDLFDTDDKSGTIVLDYSDINNPFLKLSGRSSESSFAFNMRYLSCFAGEEVTILISSPLHPIIILSENSTVDPLIKNVNEEILKEEWFYILMPIKMDEDTSGEIYI